VWLESLLHAVAVVGHGVRETLGLSRDGRQHDQNDDDRSDDHHQEHEQHAERA
jgi:hypothetical protein